ncbi:MAG TPA: hypothetical protein VGB56_03325, partial [Flavisolibacter sp.]
GAGTIGWGLSIFVIALISIFLLPRKDQKINGSNPVIPVPKIQIPQNPALRKDEKSSSTKKGQFHTAGSSEPAKLPIDSSVASTLNNLAVPNAVDTTIARPEPLVLVPPAPDSGKKKRGVSGLKDGDYRIVPKKDN